ncbi:hypothetical protein FGG78_22300 [Thioclava sp. BHET1]|nr:hypothetical protein FGG78_22300 [Thioclava sp. BHET1]
MPQQTSAQRRAEPRQIAVRRALPLTGDELELTLGEGGLGLAYRVGGALVWNIWADGETAAQLRDIANEIDNLLPHEEAQ